MDRGPLSALHRWILGGWAVVALVMALLVLSASGGASGFEDLVGALAVVFGVVSLASVAVTWAVARLLLRGPGARTAVALLGPPLLVGALVLVRRLG